MPVSAKTYERVALDDTDRIWELACGRLREKPPTTTEHDDSGRTLAVLIGVTIDLSTLFG